MDQKRNLLHIAQECFNFISPKLCSYSDFNAQHAKVIKVKEAENIQYSFDVELDQLIKKELVDIPAKVFSEESGWFQTKPNYQYKIIYDPFCNSSLASKSFREAAMGISLFDSDNTFLASLVLDYQTGLIGYVENSTHTQFYQAQTLEKISIQYLQVNNLEESWAVITLENLVERRKLSDLLPLLHKVGRLFVSSGHIYWLKLAMGTINLYSDPIGGEALYEMFGATIAQGAGCKVTDLSGKDFNPGLMLSEFEKNKNYLYHHISASNEFLHKQSITTLSID